MSITTNVTIDENVLVNLPGFGDTVVRQPDFVDFVMQTAVWIGEDATVEVSLDKVWRCAEVARQQGNYALRGLTPDRLGFVVTTYDEGFVHPAFSLYRDPVKAHEVTLWREITDVLAATEVSA